MYWSWIEVIRFTCWITNMWASFKHLSPNKQNQSFLSKTLSWLGSVVSIRARVLWSEVLPITWWIFTSLTTHVMRRIVAGINNNDWLTYQEAEWCYNNWHSASSVTSDHLLYQVMWSAFYSLTDPAPPAVSECRYCNWHTFYIIKWFW